ncbi:serine/threonine protein kinase [Martiniozyma asiatica (nom. inval.)]|nr:serine/threonine protein kinase [Martiniozyma asiatica]
MSYQFPPREQQQKLNHPKVRQSGALSSINGNAAPATPRMLRNISNSNSNSNSNSIVNSQSEEYYLNQTHRRMASHHRSLSQKDKALLPGLELHGSKNNSHNQHQNQYQNQNQNQHQHQHQHQHHPHQQQSQGEQQPLQAQQATPFHRKSIGDWEFTKTIGAGSMGKVKLAKHSITNEICAIKVVTRASKIWQRQHANDPPTSDPHELAQRKKEWEKELGRDKRTIREAALGKILYHPFICRLYEMYTMSNHYYMLFEYVQGGQMLDYIVSHGSLKESQARKFCRGVASALDYCHSNNIVHRDLKIENIMINTQGEIKIIDFGLSNMFDRENLLKTYCGSLYFAAPELLCAHPYIGPEVDVWSFGVVLYVLVCGKVPFDDKSVSTLHEKIKKGNVDYPSSLSSEVTSLLKRMLVVNPSYRATIKEIINHPWMNRGYPAPVGNHLPPRKPLELPLNSNVIQSIVELDLANNEETFLNELSNIISSSNYKIISDNWYAKKRHQSYDPSLPDPTTGIHPLISLYYLVDEMLNRKMAKASQERNVSKLQVSQQQQQQPRSHLTTPPQNHIFNATSIEPNMAHQGSHRIVTQPVPAKYQHSDSSNNNNNNNNNHGYNKDPFAEQQTPLLASPPKLPPFSLPAPPAAHTSPHQEKIPVHTFTKPAPVIEISSHQSPSPPPQQLSPQDASAGNSLFRRLSGKRNEDIRRVGSVKVTNKEKEQLQLQLQQSQLPQLPTDSKRQMAQHQRAASAYTTSAFQSEKLPPLQTQKANSRGYHPNARAKSLSHARKSSKGKNLPMDDLPPLPQITINSKSGIEGAGFFDEEQQFDNLSFNSSTISNVKPLNEKQIIEQYQKAPAGSMPSIEYPKTLFLKGFFSVQTTSTKPLPVIRYGIITILPQLGVQFIEVKGGFICIHYPSIIEGHQKLTKSPTKSISKSTLYDDDKTDLDVEKTPSESSSFNTHDKEYTASTATTMMTTTNTAASTSATGTIPTPHTPKGHRRKFSLGNAILSTSRKGEKLNVNTQLSTPQQQDIHLMPTTPAPANIIRRASDESSESLTFDETNGASDMLVSSKVEQGAQTLREFKIGSKTPLKFEIHIVKVPLVGLYGIQFKKVSGNTWLYKSLASEILNRLNL